MKILKHYKCPKCGRITSAVDLIPMCKCTGKGSRTTMEEIKKK